MFAGGQLTTLPFLPYCQEFGLARFKSNVTKTMKGFEYILAKLQGECAGHCQVPPSHPDWLGPGGGCVCQHTMLCLGPSCSPGSQPPRRGSLSDSELVGG